jgi:hypothetical protein
MKLEWTKGLTEEASKLIKQDYIAAQYLRKRLSELLSEQSDNHRKQLNSKVNYDSPSWAYLQADSVGYQRALEEVINLIK